MDESSYNALVAQAFKRMLKVLDGVDPDLVESDGTADMLTITAPKSGEKVIVNTQRAVHQLWVAGQSAGIHFSYDAGKSQWLDDKGKGLELFSWVGQCVTAVSGVRLSF